MKKIFFISSVLILLSSFNLWNNIYDKAYHNNSNQKNITKKKKETKSVDDTVGFKSNNVIKDFIQYDEKKNRINQNTSKVYVENPSNLNYTYKIIYDTYSNNSSSNMINTLYANSSMSHNLLKNTNDKLVSKNDVFNIKIQINGSFQPLVRVQLDSKYLDLLKLQELSSNTISYNIKASGILTCPEISLYENYYDSDSNKVTQIKIGEYNVYNYYKTNYQWSSQLIESSIAISVSAIIFAAAIVVGVTSASIIMLNKLKYIRSLNSDALDASIQSAQGGRELTEFGSAYSTSENTSVRETNKPISSSGEKDYTNNDRKPINAAGSEMVVPRRNITLPRNGVNETNYNEFLFDYNDDKKNYGGSLTENTLDDMQLYSNIDYFDFLDDGETLQNLFNYNPPSPLITFTRIQLIEPISGKLDLLKWKSDLVDVNSSSTKTLDLNINDLNTSNNIMDFSESSQDVSDDDLLIITNNTNGIHFINDLEGDKEDKVITNISGESYSWSEQIASNAHYTEVANINSSAGIINNGEYYLRNYSGFYNNSWNENSKSISDAPLFSVPEENNLTVFSQNSAIVVNYNGNSVENTKFSYNDDESWLYKNHSEGPILNNTAQMVDSNEINGAHDGVNNYGDNNQRVSESLNSKEFGRLDSRLRKILLSPRLLDENDANYLSWKRVANDLKNNGIWQNFSLIHDYYANNPDFLAQTEMMVVRYFAKDLPINSSNDEELFQMVTDTFSPYYLDNRLRNMSVYYIRDKAMWFLSNKQGTLWDETIQLENSKILIQIDVAFPKCKDILTKERMNLIKSYLGLEHEKFMLKPSFVKDIPTSTMFSFRDMKTFVGNDLKEFRYLKNMAHEYQLARRQWSLELEHEWRLLILDQ